MLETVRESQTITSKPNHSHKSAKNTTKQQQTQSTTTKQIKHQSKTKTIQINNNNKLVGCAITTIQQMSPK